MHERQTTWIEVLERLAALAAALVAALLASANVLRAEIVEGDALVHQYWMAQFADPELFRDPLTAALRESERYPDGYEALFRVAAQVADPVAFGEWLGVALMAITGLLVFLVARELVAWRPAAWIAGALFLALHGHRFYGGFPRGWLHVIVLLTVLLALRRHRVAAALVAAGGALVYPPAALLAVGVLAVTALRVERWRPRVVWPHARAAVLAAVLAAVAVVTTQLGAGGGGDVLTSAEARTYAEFGDQGGLHFFVPSPLEYARQNRSGFDLRTTGSTLLLAALVLLLARPANVRLLRAEVLALPVVALAGYAAAQAVLFRLYLPHRYTYPLLAFVAVVVGVALLPTWQALLTCARPRLWAAVALLAPLPIAAAALVVFPLGPMDDVERLTGTAPLIVAGAAVALAVVAVALVGRVPRARAAAGGAALTGLVLLGTLLAAPDRGIPGQPCLQRPAVRFIATLPKDAVIAGEPTDLNCLPVSARRAVVISTKLAPSYEREYFLAARQRMYATLRAYYGPSREGLAVLASRYGATHLLVRGNALRRERTERGFRWPAGRLPYGPYVRELVRSGPPAITRLPRACRRFKDGPEEVYELACIERRDLRPIRASSSAGASAGRRVVSGRSPRARPRGRPRPAAAPPR